MIRATTITVCLLTAVAMCREPEAKTGDVCLYVKATGQVLVWGDAFSGVKPGHATGRSATATGRESNVSEIADLAQVQDGDDPLPTRAEIYAEMLDVMASDDNPAQKKAAAKALRAKLQKLAKQKAAP